MRVLQERNKLHYVSRLIHLVSVRVQRRIISIQLLHAGEVSGADTYDNNRKRKSRCIDNGVYGLLHIHDGAVGQDKQDCVLLVILRLFLHLLVAIAGDVVNDWLEVGGTQQASSHYCVLVHVADTLDAVDLGLEDVAVEGETVAHFHGFYETTSETKDWILFVGIILLKDGTDRLNCLQVLVWLVSIHEV